MTSFQILDLSFEEDLSDDQAMSIDGGGFAQDVVNQTLALAQSAVEAGTLTAQQAIDAAYAFLEDAVAACQTSDNVDACLRDFYGIV